MMRQVILLCHFWNTLARCYPRPAFTSRVTSLPPSKWTSRRRQLHTSSYLDSLSTQQTLRTLYPSIQPYANDSIQVSSLHTLQYQIYGNPDGLPALFLHGGPGAGCYPNHARFFDPDKYCIVLLNQRGANDIGRGEFLENTLLDLVGDCEMLRKDLHVPAWSVVLGGSWGTTLALAYAQEHPDRIKSLILRAVCLLRPEEVNWLTGKDGVATFDPEGYRAFCQAVNATSESNVLEGYYRRLLSNDPVQRLEAAKGWMTWEMRVSSIRRDEKDGQAPVLVGKWGSWEYQDGEGKEILQDDMLSPRMQLEHLKRTVPDRQRHYQASMLPTVQDFSPMSTTTSNATNDNDLRRFIPSQAILTCFYSVNHDFCLNHIDLLSQDRMANVLSIPTIAIHGGLDMICPINNALDLLEAWPGLELRVCTKAGHSMYEDAITNELIQATDRFAKLREDPPMSIFE